MNRFWYDSSVYKNMQHLHAKGHAKLKIKYWILGINDQKILLNPRKSFPSQMLHSYPIWPVHITNLNLLALIIVKIWTAQKVTACCYQQCKSGEITSDIIGYFSPEIESLI